MSQEQQRVSARRVPEGTARRADLLRRTSLWGIALSVVAAWLGTGLIASAVTERQSPFGWAASFLPFVSLLVGLPLMFWSRTRRLGAGVVVGCFAGLVLSIVIF